MNTRSSERINGLAVLLRGYAGMVGELAGAQWNEGDVSDSVVRRVALPDAFFAIDGLLETFLTVLDEFGAYPAVIARELDRYLPFLATTAVLMAAVRAGVGRETAHEVIKEHAVAVALAMREKGQADNDLLARLAADERLGLPGRPRRPARRPAARSPARPPPRSRRSSRGWTRDRRRPPGRRRLHPRERSCEAAALGQGPRPLPRRSGDEADLLLVASDRHLDLRRRAAHADPGQGRGAHAAVAVVVRAARRPRAPPRALGHRRARPSSPAGRVRCRRLEMLPGRVHRPRLPRRARGSRSTRSTARCPGCALPAGLVEGSRLPEPIFTPTTKAPVGEHDEFLTFADVEALVGAATAERLRALTLAVYRRGAELAAAQRDPRRRHEAGVRPRRRRARSCSPTRC